MNTLLNRLLVIYGEPDSPDPAVYFKEISALIEGYSEAVLSKAGDTIIREYRGRSFPKPSDIVKACREACEGIPANADTTAKYPGWSPKDFEIADRLIVSDLGREAAENGWSLSLHEFCRFHHRLPNEHEQQRCKNISRDFDRNYAQSRIGSAGALGMALEGLGDRMLAKRQKYADMAHGVVT